MDRQLEVSDMPPLSDTMHGMLRALEHALKIKLGSCCGNHHVIDPDAALEYARTYAITFYDCFYDFYSHFPNKSYEPHWQPASEKFAYQRVVQCVGNFSVLNSFLWKEDRDNRIKKTITEHAETRLRSHRYGLRRKPLADEALGVWILARLHIEERRLRAGDQTPLPSQLQIGFVPNEPHPFCDGSRYANG
jgi:hypothetical protein